MRITKDIKQMLNRADTVTLLQYSDGMHGMIIGIKGDDFLQGHNFEIDIEASNPLNRFHLSLSCYDGNVISTVISCLRENDNIELRVLKNVTSDITLYKVLLYVRRPYRNTHKEYMYLLHATTENFL